MLLVRNHDVEQKRAIAVDHLFEAFVEVLLAVKLTEHEAYQSVISSWEREHLLLNV